MQDEIKSYIADSIKVKESVFNLSKEIETLVSWMLDTYKNKNKIIAMGNGGSASDAEHLVCEIVGRFKLERKSLPAVALTSNSSTVTAIANDYGYENLFSRQIEGYANKGDIVLGISTSGNSENVILGIKKAKELGCRTVCLLGKDGGKLKDLCDLAIIVKSYDTPKVQESHIMIIHIICQLFEARFFKDE